MSTENRFYNALMMSPFWLAPLLVISILTGGYFYYQANSERNQAIEQLHNVESQYKTNLEERDKQLSTTIALLTTVQKTLEATNTKYIETLETLNKQLLTKTTDTPKPVTLPTKITKANAINHHKTKYHRHSKHKYSPNTHTAHNKVKTAHKVYYVAYY